MISQNSIFALEGQFAGGGLLLQSAPPSGGVLLSRVFMRAMAPREISIMVQFSTSLSSVVFVTSIMLSAIPTCAPLTCSRNTTAMTIAVVATAAAKRSRTTLSHLCRQRRRNSGRWEFSTLRMFLLMTALDQPKARIVSRPST